MGKTPCRRSLAAAAKTAALSKQNQSRSCSGGREAAQYPRPHAIYERRSSRPRAAVRRPSSCRSVTDSTEPQKWRCCGCSSHSSLGRRYGWFGGWKKSKSSSGYPHSKICVQTLRPCAVDPELHFQTNRDVRPGPLGQNDLARGTCAGEWL